MASRQSWFSDTPVRNKILVGYGLLLAVMVAIGAIIFAWTGVIGGARAELQRGSEILHSADQAGMAVAERTAAFRDFLLSGDEEAVVEMNEADDRFELFLAEARENTVDRGQLALLDSAAEYSRIWKEEVAEPGIALRRQAESAAAAAQFFLQGEGRRGAQRTLNALREFQVRQLDVASEQGERLGDAVSTMRLAVWCSSSSPPFWGWPSPPSSPTVSPGRSGAPSRSRRASRMAT